MSWRHRLFRTPVRAVTVGVLLLLVAMLAGPVAPALARPAPWPVDPAGAGSDRAPLTSRDGDRTAAEPTDPTDDPTDADGDGEADGDGDAVTPGIDEGTDGTVVAAESDPLRITIDSLSPSVLPRSGPITLSGEVTNTDLDVWHDIYLYPYLNTDDCRADATCQGPMTTKAELEAAADSPPDSVVGERITDLDVRDTVAELAPGESASFTLTVPQRVLRAEIAAPQQGVYWFGVHASGYSDAVPRDDFADGRARTFLPYLPDRRPGSFEPVHAAVVVPLRSIVSHRADGRVARVTRWRHRVGVHGILGRMLTFGAAAGSHPVNWVLDPAVLDVVERISLGNPPRQLLPPPEEPTDDPSSSPTTDAEAEADAVDRAAASPAANAARSWLTRAEDVLTGASVYTLPYGDPDLTGGAATADTYDRARRDPGTVATAWKLDGTPVISAPGGYLDPEVFTVLADDDAVTLLADQMLTDPVDAPAVGAHPVVATDTAAADGGPGPDAALGPIALRQRFLSEAAVRLLTAGDAARPVVLEVPREAGVAGAGEFWSGLDLPWLQLDSLSDLAAGDRTQVDPATLAYPDAVAQTETPAGHFTDAEALLAAGSTLQAILGETSTVGRQVSREALTGVSFEQRGQPDADRRLVRSRNWIERRLRAVSISAPPGVTLSSASGRFAVTVGNNLDVPVTVRVTAVGGDGIEIRPSEPVVLGPDSRTSVSLQARTSTPGVHTVRLSLTDLDGNPLGNDDVVPVRSGQVSEVIWVIIGAGVAILFLAIVLRLVRRLRRGRSAGEETDADTDETRAGDASAADDAAADPGADPAGESEDPRG